jgi:hypothetical protein
MPTLKYSAELLLKIKGFVAEDAVGISAVRGQAKGTRKTAIEYVRSIDLSRIPRSGQAVFIGWLDAQTESLRHKLPDASHPWGVARGYGVRRAGKDKLPYVPPSSGAPPASGLLNFR